MAGVIAETTAAAAKFRKDHEISTISVAEYQKEVVNHEYSCNNNYHCSGGLGGGGVSEIEEVNPSDELFEINNWNGEDTNNLSTIREEVDGCSLFSFDIQNGDNVYVGVGKNESSIDALAWTLKHAVTSTSTFVYLIHVFPEVHYIPTPLGKLAKSQVSQEQVENYMAQERGKRRDFLQKFLNMGSASKVKVDTMLIESDTVAKSILDLIPILNIKKLVLGTNKSSLRKLRSRKGNGIAGQILQNAPERCDVTIVCEGNEVSVEQINGLSSSPRHYNDDSSNSNSNSNSTPEEEAPPPRDSFCVCFKA